VQSPRKARFRLRLRQVIKYRSPAETLKSWDVQCPELFVAEVFNPAERDAMTVFLKVFPIAADRKRRRAILLWRLPLIAKESIMSITSPAVSAAQTAVQRPPEKAEPVKVGYSAADAKYQLNVQILEASAKVSLTAGDDPLSLVFRSAIDRINELLSPELGPDALQNAAGQDNSAEATAGRILSLSTAFYEGYAKQHAGEAPEEIARNFVALVRGGFEKGFGEAQGILEGLGVFNGNVKGDVMKTWELVQKGYDDFLTGKLEAINTPVEA
jgi:hypothetical protein